MQFRELVLHNVGVYRGRQSMDLSTSTSRPVILIGGLNGCGKTTLLDAIQMVLYGRRARVSNRGTQSWDAFLRESINRSAPGSEGASIELTFDVDLEGAVQEYRVVRSWSVSGKTVREFVTAFVNGKVNRTLSQGWSEHIEELLPLDIASLFFFDGEKIESLADPETASTVVRTAVHSLLGIGTIEQLRNDLLAMQRRQSPPSGGTELDTKVESLTRDLARLEHERDAVDQRIADLQGRSREMQRTLESAERAFERDGGELFEQRNALEKDRASAVTELRQTQDQLRTLAEGALPLGLVEEQIQAVAAQTKRESAAADDRRFVALLEERDAWLVKQLDEIARAQVEQVLRDDRKQLSARAHEESYLCLSDDARAQLNAVEPALAESRGAGRALLAKAESNSARLEEVDSQLAGVPAEDAIADRIRVRDQARLDVAALDGQLHAHTEERERLVRAAQQVHDEMTRVEVERREIAVKSDYVRRVLEHSDKARTTLAELRERLIAQHIGKIEVATLESFLSLMRKRGLVRDLRIDSKTFVLHLVGKDGDELPASRLSAGERQLLAVALLWGLARVAGNRLPTVIDTPLGRLDSEHRKHLVQRYFPNAGGQVLLLSTDEEIDRDLLTELTPALSSTYLLTHEDSKHETTIERGYWWSGEDKHVA